MFNPEWNVFLLPCRHEAQDGTGSPNATWGNLMEVLNDSEQEELAGRVKNALGL